MCVIFAAAGLFAVRFPNVSGVEIGAVLSTLVIAAPAVVALAHRFGVRRAAIAWASLAVLGYAVETIGLTTGFPYGEFYYGQRLGPQLPGGAPLILPISWAPLVIGAVAASEPRERGELSFLRRLGWVVASAALLVAMDGVLDPGAAHLGYWVWPNGGAYYGVPASNYIGWAFSSLLASSVLIAVAPWRSTRLVRGLSDSALVSLAFWSSAALFAGLWTPFVLGVALLVYLVRRRSLRLA